MFAIQIILVNYKSLI